MDRVVLLDAVSSGATPGTIHRFDAHTDTIPAKFYHYSTHAFSVAEAVELARTLNKLPQHLIVYGIEGKNFEAGVSLSAEVEKAVEQVIEKVVEEVIRMPSAALKGGAGKHA